LRLEGRYEVNSKPFDYNESFEIDPEKLQADPIELVTAFNSLCSEGVVRHIPASAGDNIPHVVLRPVAIRGQETVYSFVTREPKKLGREVLAHDDVTCISVITEVSPPLIIGSHHKEIKGVRRNNTDALNWDAKHYLIARHIIEFAKAT
jgi:hypothetical protein